MTGLWSEDDLAIADELMSVAYVRHDLEFPLHGSEQYKALVRTSRQTFPDLEFSAEHIVAEGDKVFVRWKARTSVRRGKAGEIRGTDLLHIVAGHITESWLLFDAMSLRRQIGLVRCALLVRRLRMAARP